MNKNSIDYLNRILILIFAAIFIWSLWPLPEAHQVYKVVGDYIDSDLIDDCPTLTGMVGANVELDYPEKIWRSETAEILLSIYPEQTQYIADGDTKSVCNLTLEATLAVSDLRIEPGERIVVPFSGVNSQTLIFSITSYSNNSVAGKLWISADAYDIEGQSIGRVPMFVIPLEIEVISIFGLPPTIARYGCVFALMLQLLIAFRKRLFA